MKGHFGPDAMQRIVSTRANKIIRRQGTSARTVVWQHYEGLVMCQWLVNCCYVSNTSTIGSGTCPGRIVDLATLATSFVKSCLKQNITLSVHQYTILCLYLFRIPIGLCREFWANLCRENRCISQSLCTCTLRLVKLRRSDMGTSLLVKLQVEGDGAVRLHALGVGHVLVIHQVYCFAFAGSHAHVIVPATTACQRHAPPLLSSVSVYFPHTLIRPLGLLSPCGLTHVSLEGLVCQCCGHSTAACWRLGLLVQWPRWTSLRRDLFECWSGPGK